MTKAKHTPWDFLVNDGAWEVFDTRGHTVACNLTEANARLISAAPKMYALLAIRSKSGDNDAVKLLQEIDDV